MLQEQAKKGNSIIKEDTWASIEEFLDIGLHLGQGDRRIDITIGLLLLLTIAFLITSFALKLLRQLFTRKMESEDKLKFISIFKFIKYLVYVAVILITMKAAGIDITIVLTASAALFVGLGLALQELFQDVMAGVFIIVDKSINIGDIVEVEGKVGKVFEIKLRTTRAITRDDKVIIIPNHKFISDTVYNYTQNHKTTREKVTIGVSYGSDVDLVTKLLEDVALANRAVLKNPKPFVFFEDFGDSALIFSLNFFTKDVFGEPRIKSEMRYAIDKKFREHNIVIPFPQRDLHIYQDTPIRLKQVGESGQNR